MAIIRCPHCGTANRVGSNFCNRCGAILRAEDREPGSIEEEAQPNLSEQSDAQAESELDSHPQEHSSTPDTTDTEAVAEQRAIDADEATEPDGEPWLRMEFAAEEDAPPFDDDETTEPALESERLVDSMPGLLAPVRIEISAEETIVDAVVDTDVGSVSQVELWRRVRTRMASPPLLARLSFNVNRPKLNNLKVNWLFLILMLAVTIPAFFAFAWPAGSVNMWPGVEAAFTTIDGLPPNSNVQIYWAYDPSTAGELDLAALPVTTHLFQKQAVLSVVTQLPAAPATARRILAQARMDWQRDENLTITAISSRAIPIAYLPGGAAVLALAGQDLQFVQQWPLLNTLETDTARLQPDLTIILAARADDVQHWLEQVQPFTLSRTIAVVAAGADPVLRPYVDSGQLVGLVSGFDGAYNYQRLLDEQAKRGSDGRFDLQLVLQDWGHFVFFLAIVLGNFAAVLRRGDESVRR